ncbi:hypothetical protein B7R77_24755 [Ralstonia solanacearum K60]|uniref:Uncharacterized protein n=1 Tax=Ralstonia solanacearum K60 TaxID=1091042 RepID=A0AAP8D2H6_RALSL|nr:hypothetical protein B7R77_24755 [Ralstonia solanacearum K60]
MSGSECCTVRRWSRRCAAESGAVEHRMLAVPVWGVRCARSGRATVRPSSRAVSSPSISSICPVQIAIRSTAAAPERLAGPMRFHPVVSRATRYSEAFPPWHDSAVAARLPNARHRPR